MMYTNRVHFEESVAMHNTAKINVYGGDEGLVFSSGEGSFNYSHSSSYMTNIQSMRSECNTYWKERIHTQSASTTLNKSSKNFELHHNIT